MANDDVLPRESFVRANGLLHHVLTWDGRVDGEPAGADLVLLHGFLDLAWSFDAFARLVAARAPRRRIIAFDFRGHGETDWVGAGGYYHFPDYVLDLDELVRALGHDAAPFHLFGHSMGGTVATLFAGARPALVRSLVLAEGLGPPTHTADRLYERTVGFLDGVKRVRETAARPPKKPMRSAADALARMRLSNPELGEERGLFLAEKGTKPLDDGTRAWRFDPLHKTTSPSIYRLDHMQPFFAKLTMPVLYVGGTRGYRLPDEAARLALMPVTAEVAELEGAGHMLHWTHEQALADVIAVFLSRVESSTMLAR